MESFFFWFFAIGMLLSGAGVVINRSPIASAFCLVGTIIFLAGLFVLLNAFFLAAIQVLVYAGAVMVLFLFIIMLLDLKAEAVRPRKFFVLVAGVAVSLLFCYGLSQVLESLPMGLLRLSDLPARTTSDVPEIGTLLFTRYLLPFEITSLLLLVATVGVILLSRKEDKK
jgi:NADH-quinone oxidoreductase subunit J